jgi:phenylacetic acid degradation operon negative regulatory protein
MPVSRIVSAHLDRFHAERPVRAWSLITTLYGDAIVPRGGSLWLGSLTEIMALFRIDAGHVRTAMSRLTADGWLDRVKIGRNSYYRLSKRGEGAFIEATQRIYFAHTPAFDGRLKVALLGPGVDDRSAVRPALQAAGFVPLSPTAYVAFSDSASRLRINDGVFLLTADAGNEMRALAAAAWKLDPIVEAYRAFIDRFAPLDAQLARHTTMQGGDALVTRTLLIHAFRRIVLRDPGLPAALLPSDWPAVEARALAARIYRRVVLDSEAFLDAHAVNEVGALRPPEPAFAARFSSI